jgi:hypothetical protein
LDEYKTQFEILANRVHRLIDPHKLSCFLGGLRDDIRLPVTMFNPKTLNNAYSLAKIQEECIAINLKSGKSVWYSSKSQGVGGGNNAAFVRSGNAYGNRMQYSQPKQYQGGFGGNNQQKGSSHENLKAFVPIQKISPAQMDERRKKGLCYSCDAKWSRGHVCDTPKLFLIEEIEEDSIIVEEIVEKEEEDLGKFFMDQEPEISLNAITGNPNPKTMRMIGIIKGQQVTILIDSGSTHNFVDEQVAKLIGLKSTSKNVIKVRIANGQQISSPGKCEALSVKVQGNVFQVDLYILPLAGCDVVLGIQWLRLLGPILWNFDDLTMVFQWGTRRCSLKGLQQGPKLSWENESSFRWLKKGNKGVVLQLIEAGDSSEKEHSIAAAEMVQNSVFLDDLLEGFKDIFQVPTELPPKRAHDHAIKLQAGV